jgi:tripartite-type tricarboxylate transporter receptor subunit TctC
MRVFRLLITGLTLLAGSGAVAQTAAYPDRPIKMIVPLAAASAIDVAARIVTQKMADNMGQQIVIINQSGASGLIGAEQVAKAEPDGYTIGGFNDSIMTMVPNLQSNMRWDILRDFEPVSLVATVEWGLIASNKTGLHNAADLIAPRRPRLARSIIVPAGRGVRSTWPWRCLLQPPELS